MSDRHGCGKCSDQRMEESIGSLHSLHGSLFSKESTLLSTHARFVMIIRQQNAIQTRSRFDQNLSEVIDIELGTSILSLSAHCILDVTLEALL